MNNKGKLGYVAGILDGEGSIIITNSKLHTRTGNPYNGYLVRVTIANTSEPLMKHLVFHFGGVYRPKKQRVNKICYQWECTGGNEKKEKFLLAVLPYMLIKREQALLALEFIRMGRATCPEKRAEMRVRMVTLNCGQSVTTNTSNTQIPNLSEERV